MVARDERDNLIETIESLLAPMRSHGEPKQAEAIVAHVDQHYRRVYLSRRLPAEILRTEMTRRPFSVGMFRLERAGAESGFGWQRRIEARLSLLEVGVGRNRDEFFILYPERGEKAAYHRHFSVIYEVMEEAPLTSGQLYGAVVCYEAKGIDESQVWAESEKLLHRLAEALAPVRETALEEYLIAAEEGEESLPLPDESAMVPVAVGFAAGRRFPITLWHGNDLQLIDAVLGDRLDPSGRRVLDVKTERGIQRLIEEKGRWYLETSQRSSHG